MKALLSKPAPSGDAVNPLRECQTMLADASTYAKHLRHFEEAVQKFNKSADVVLQQSVHVVGNALDPQQTEQVRGSLHREMDDGVQKPITQWLAEYKEVKSLVKELDRLCGDFGSSEAAVNKATVKKVKAEQANAEQKKQDKLLYTLQNKQGTLEMTRSAYHSQAPQVQMRCRQLLASRDELRVRLYSVFSISSDNLQRVATMRSHDSASGGARTALNGYHSPSAHPVTPVQSSGPPGGPSYNNQATTLPTPAHYQSSHVNSHAAGVPLESAPPYPVHDYAGVSPFYAQHEAAHRQEYQQDKQRPYPAYP